MIRSKDCGRRQAVMNLPCLIAFVFLSCKCLMARGSEPNSEGRREYGHVDISRVRNADRNPGLWATMGRTLDGTYYSPLSQINTSNAAKLGFVWEFKTGTYRGMDATPLFVDGVLYFPGIWGSVYALDAASGNEIWRFTPKNDGQFAKWAASDVVTRGIAVLDQHIFTVSTDCRLFALEAANGQVVWQTDTLAERAPGYVCEGPPLVTDRFVIVGNAGGDNLAGGVRGYISAFDLKSGHLAWRLYTVPRLGERHADPALVAASRTWDPMRDPTFGGGGTVWGQMTYDPELDLVYFGTGNAAPYNAPRDWSGRASDRLYAASIVAVHARTGRMAWYYQTTPGDIWDFDATANPVLASLRIGGVDYRVLMQANKNGFFYVIDRQTGKPISAAPFAYMNWATGMDAGFRPIVNRIAADYNAAPKIVYPSVLGAHSWPPMSYNRQTGLVYIPVLETGSILADVTKNRGSRLSWLDQQYGITEIVPDKMLSYDYWESLVGALPRFDAPPRKDRSLLRDLLRAWDPITRQVVWEQQTSQDYAVLDGGTMTTAGGLVFAGREDGAMVVYDAKTGTILKTIQTGSAIMAAPMTFEVGGRQYVSVLCGHGGMFLNFLGTAAWDYINEDRILTFALDGLPRTPTPSRRTPPATREEPGLARTGSPELVKAGRDLFLIHCARCHTLNTPAISSDLTRSPTIYSIDMLDAILLRGALVSGGMGRFDDVLTNGDVSAIQTYLVNEAWDSYQEERADSTTMQKN
jgi:quinohemoprotein ethanol dehydrogenase